MTNPVMPSPNTDDPQSRSQLGGLMRWWRGLGLGLFLFAVLLFSRDQDVAGYVALAAGWVVLIYAIIARTRHNRQRMADREG